MRIAFLCGSQEAGRDGVGDYTAGLVDELRLQGHDVMVIGLRDKYIDETVSTERLVANYAIPVLRLPSSLPWRKCVALAREALDRFAPDWVSIQFVSYIFHPKGLVRGLARQLKPLIAGRRLHIMFHEIWLSRELGWGGRHRALGALQRLFIQRFVVATKPVVIHTTNATYASLLRRNGIPAVLLGLFGAIPIPAVAKTAWIEGQMRKSVGSEYRREAFWLFGLFGALHSQWSLAPLMDRLCRAAQAAGKRPVLLSIGRTGEAGMEFWTRLSLENADRFDFILLGEQSPEHVAEFLSYLDYGITTTPRSILGKSSTVVSMFEHGLPVIVNRDDVSCESETDHSEPLIVSCDADLERRLQGGVKKATLASRRLEITQAFLKSLEAFGDPSDSESFA